MAKKKVTPQHQEHKLQNPQEETETQHPKQEHNMDDPEEKLQNLKSLNSMLLKETIEKRQQVESLIQAKQALEDELSKFCTKSSQLESELRVESDKGVILDIEKALFGVFFETQVREMGVFVDRLVKEERKKVSEIGVLDSEVKKLTVSLESEREKLGRVVRERDALKDNFDVCEKEANGLKERVLEMERMGKKNEDECLKLKAEYGLLSKEIGEKEREITELKKLKDSADRDRVLRVSEVEDLKEQIERITMEKGEVERERNSEKIKIRELEGEVSKLNETILALRKEEGFLRIKFSEIEKSYGKIVEKEKAMEMEIGDLVEERKEKERVIESLMEEKRASKQSLEMVNGEMKQKSSLIEKLLREKKEIETVKDCKEQELVEMHKEVNRLRENVSSMHGWVKAIEEKNEKLALEVAERVSAIERVTIERDTALAGLNEEKKKVSDLNYKVVEMDKFAEKNVKEFAELKRELEDLTGEKKEMESRVFTLNNEKDSIHCNLLEARKEIDDLRSKIEAANINSKRVLTILKNISSSLRESTNGKEVAVVNDKRLDDEIEPYVMELEVIKNAYINKEAMVEEMKQQVESLQKSVAKANEKKSFWTIVSSATTVLAAISLAYVARLR